MTGDTRVMRPVPVCLAPQEAGQAKEYGESLQHGVNLPEGDFLAAPGHKVSQREKQICRESHPKSNAWLNQNAG